MKESNPVETSWALDEGRRAVKLAMEDLKAFGITERDRIHVSDQPLEYLEGCNYRKLTFGPEPACHGRQGNVFWYALGLAWLRLLQREYITQFMGCYVYRVYMNMDRMLVVRNRSEMNAFLKDFDFGKKDWIDWQEVAEAGYAGMEITTRGGLPPEWHFPSGAVWDVTAVDDLELLWYCGSL